MTLDFPSWLRHMRLHHKQEDFAQAFAQLENFSANDASFKDLDWVTTWLWVYGSRKVETSDIFETSSSWVWMNEAFVQSTPGTLQHRALAVMVCWNQFPLPQVLAPAKRNPGYDLPLARKALLLSEHPAWWRLCLSPHGNSLTDYYYDSHARFVCLEAAPDHPYVRLMESLGVTLDQVIALREQHTNCPISEIAPDIPF